MGKSLRPFQHYLFPDDYRAQAIDSGSCSPAGFHFAHALFCELICKGITTLFLRPGNSFSVADAMLSNFHLPESFLFVLVGAFMGIHHMQEAHAEAVNEDIDFFPTGMPIIWKNKELMKRN